MSKLTQIETALRAIDPAEFQRLGDAYLRQRGYDKINPIGLVIGADKVRKGTPDTLIPLPNGNYVCVQHTTEQKRIGTKLLKDIKDCFDEKKSRIPPSRIEEIVLCHTSVLSPAEEHALVEYCRGRGRLNVFGLGTIAHDLAEKYPGLARDYLGIAIDTGQIVTLDEFVTASSRTTFSTPLDTTFRFRDKQLLQTIADLEQHSVIVISGHPGVGKSRYAVECCRAYAAAHPGVEVRCIRNLGADLTGDIRAHFTPPGQYLILVDDANRVSGFPYLLHLLHEERQDRTVKLIVTVRDYSRPKVDELLRPFGGSVKIELKPLSDDEIKELAEQEFGITNFHFLTRIRKIAKGNPRLAVMACRIVVEQETLGSIADVSALYDEYFRSVRQDLADVGDPALLQAAGIIAFYRAVDRSSEAQAREIEEGFGVSAGELWSAVRRLHDLELVDLYEDEVVRLADQVLATYLFYLAFFREKALNPGALLGYFFPKYRHKLFDALNPALTAFDAKGIVGQLRPVVSARWKELDTPDTQDELLVLAEAFGALDPTATLRLLRDRIGDLAPEPVDLSAVSFVPSSSVPEPSLYSLIGNFRHSELGTIEIALRLLLDLVAKRPAEVKHALHLFADRYGIAPESHFRRFEVEATVVHILGAATQDGNNLLLSGAFLVVAERYLRTHFTHVESESRNTLTQTTFDLVATPELRALRLAIWQRVIALYRVPALQMDVLRLIRAHARGGYEVRSPELLASDAAVVLPALDGLLDPNRYVHCAVVQGCLRLLRQHQVVLGDELAALRERVQQRFASESYQVAVVLIDEFEDPQERATLGWEEYGELRRKRMREHFAGYGTAEYEGFLEGCVEIREAALLWGERSARWELRQQGPNRDDYQLRIGVGQVLGLLYETDPDLFRSVVERYLGKGDFLQLQPGWIVPRLVAAVGTQRAAGILEAAGAPQSANWWFAFFMALAPEAITTDWRDRLLKLYEDAPVEILPQDLDYLQRYEGIDPVIVRRVTAILVARAQEDQRIGLALAGLTGRGPLSGRLPELFRQEPRLLEKAYFAASKAEPQTDYDAKGFSTLLDFDPAFGARWVEWMAEQKEWLSRYDDNRHYQVLWLRDDHQVVFRALLTKLYELSEAKPLSMFRYPQVFFAVADGAASGDPGKIRQRQDTLLLTMLEERAQDFTFVEFLFDIVRDRGAERRRAFVAAFVKWNQRIEDFKRLPLEPSMWEWSGSRVPMYQAMVDFYELLIPALNTVDLLDHKLLIERQIAELRQTIEAEKRKDFMGED